MHTSQRKRELFCPCSTFKDAVLLGQNNLNLILKIVDWHHAIFHRTHFLTAHSFSQLFLWFNFRSSWRKICTEREFQSCQSPPPLHCQPRCHSLALLIWITMRSMLLDSIMQPFLLWQSILFCSRDAMPQKLKSKTVVSVKDNFKMHWSFNHVYDVFPVLAVKRHVENTADIIWI